MHPTSTFLLIASAFFIAAVHVAPASASFAGYYSRTNCSGSCAQVDTSFTVVDNALTGFTAIPTHYPWLKLEGSLVGGLNIALTDAPVTTCQGIVDPKSMTVKLQCQFVGTSSQCTVAFQRTSTATQPHNDAFTLAGDYSLLNCQCGSGLPCSTVFDKQYSLIVQSTKSDDVTFALNPLGSSLGFVATGHYHPSTQAMTLRNAPSTACGGMVDILDNSVDFSCNYRYSPPCNFAVQCTDGPCAGKPYPVLSGVYNRTSCSGGDVCPSLFDTVYNTSQIEGSVTIAPVQGKYLANIGTITTTGGIQISSIDDSVQCTGTYSSAGPREVTFNCGTRFSTACSVKFSCTSGNCMKA